MLSNYYCEKSEDYRKDNQNNKSITVLKNAIDINDQCSRAYKYLFELNMILPFIHHLIILKN